MNPMEHTTRLLPGPSGGATVTARGRAPARAEQRHDLPSTIGPSSHRRAVSEARSAKVEAPGPPEVFELTCGLDRYAHLAPVEGVEAAIEASRSCFPALCGHEIVASSLATPPGSAVPGLPPASPPAPAGVSAVSGPETPPVVPPTGGPTDCPVFRDDAVPLGPFDTEPLDLFPVVAMRGDGSPRDPSEIGACSTAWMLSALTAAGVVLGAHDRHLAGLLAEDGWSIVQTVAGWVTRANPAYDP